MKFKQKKWYNLGDINPRIHGGLFVKRDGDEIETVSTDVLEMNSSNGYWISSRIDYIDEIKEEYEKFKKDPENNKGIGSTMDWKQWIKMEKEGMSYDDLLFYIATDMVRYHGGDSESQFVTNYWETLKSFGITPNNYQ